MRREHDWPAPPAPAPPQPRTLPYSRQQVTEEDIAAVVSVLRSDWLTTGPKVQEFEEALAAYVGARYCVAVSSGTAALELAYMAALGDAVGHVVTSPLSFVATANAALRVGHTVGFVDVDAATGNVASSTLECDIFVPVHYAGRACPMPVHAPALPPLVIEDACHALGAWDFDGCSRVGSCVHSLATVFSFHPVKPMTTGEGGAITTNSEALAGLLMLLRSHGRDESGRMVALGTNARMTDFQAALGLSQLKRVDYGVAHRFELALVYWREWQRNAKALRDVDMPLLAGIVMDEQVLNASAWHLLTARIRNGRRDEVKAKLNAQGIGATVHYPAIHLQPYYRERFHYQPGAFPQAEAWADEELSLPLFAGMTEADVVRVCDALKEALA